MKQNHTSINKYSDEILYTLHKQQSSYRPETFHELRVDIKKIHAYFKMLEFSNDNFLCQKHFKPFLKIFKRAGKVREIDIEEKLFLFYFKTDKIRNLLSHLHELKKIRRDIFFASLTQKSITDIKKMLRKGNIKKVDMKNFKRYFSFKRKQIIKLCKQKKLTVIQYHKLRRRLKELLYNLSIVYPKQNASLTIDLFKLSKQLGEWHDVIDVKTHIDKMVNKNRIHESESKAVKIALSKITTSEKKLMSSIDRMRKNIYKITQ